MTVEEVKLFIKEMEAVKKLQHYLPIELLNDHISDITKEIEVAREFIPNCVDLEDLVETMQQIRSGFESELHNR
jgi:hypothetical protein